MNGTSKNPTRVNELEKSKNKYLRPFPKDTVVRGVIYDSPAHIGPFRGAMDFSVDIGTPTLSPLGGKVTEVVDWNDRYGPTEEFINDANYITIKHRNGEFSQVLHLAKGSARVQIGDKIRTGQEIAISGNSGWMTKPHLHMFVFKNLKDGGFKGLEIQFKE